MKKQKPRVDPGTTIGVGAGPVVPPAAALPPVPRGGMTDPEIMAALREIAEARPDGEDGAPVKTAERLKALELLHRYNAEIAGPAAAGGEALTIRLEVLDGVDP